jgi:hypothetical protein
MSVEFQLYRGGDIIEILLKVALNTIILTLFRGCHLVSILSLPLFYNNMWWMLPFSVID